MKNIFDYATKELSQDAFLMWLLDSYDDPEISNITYALLHEFCEFTFDEKVLKMDIEPQRHKIDIIVWITTSKSREIMLCIEDKAGSSEHNQLTKYDEFIDNIIEKKDIYKIFYKANELSEQDIEGIYKANLNNKHKWKTYSIKEITSFFRKHLNNENTILNAYIEHIEHIYKACKNSEKPIKNKTKIDRIAWKSFFKNYVEPSLSKQGYDCAICEAGRYPYALLKIWKANSKCNIPYLEIRSRDCCDNSFCARFLCYGVFDNIKTLEQELVIKQKQQQLIERVEQCNEFECKGLRKINPKQLGFSHKEIKATSKEEFVSLIEKYAKTYLDLMKDWD